MDAKFTIDISSVLKGFERIEKKVAKRIGRLVLRNATKKLKDAVSDLIPEDTGTVKSSLIVRKDVNAKRGAISFRVYTDVDKLDLDAHKSANFAGYVPAILEYGSAHHKPLAPMRTAYLANVETLGKYIVTECLKEVDNA